MQTSEQFIKTSRIKTRLKNTLRDNGLQQQLPESAGEEFQSRIQHNKYLSTLVKQQRMKKIAKFLSSYRGSNLPIAYQPKYNFTEKWQTKQKQNDFQNFTMQYIQGRYFWLNLALMPFLFAQIWFISIFRIFRLQDYQMVFIIGLLQQTISFLIKCYLFSQKYDQKIDLLSQLLKYLSKKDGIFHICKVYSITYYLLMVFHVGGISQRNHLCYLFFDAVIIFFKYSKVQNIYRKIKFKAFGSKYKNYMHLFDLLSNIFLMLHCFAILLFLCTYYNPESNWLTISPLNLDKNWLNEYLTAIYFSSTTMLTVGYGDLRPTNGVEVLCVILVQLLGISFNAYAINEIGINLSQMRHEKQSLQRDLSNAQKLSSSNKMSRPLKQKMYNQILKHQYRNEELEISQQYSLMNRLNLQIKQEIQQQNQIRIAKSCLFFLCNFTKRFQIDLSKKLVKVLYPPNTTLVQIYGKQRLYLITKGQVDVMTQKRYQGRKLSEKILKTIQIKDKNNIFLSQTYGISAFFSGRPSRIKAVAKNFTTCYILEQTDIYQTILDGDEDFQKYHYIKIKYHLSKMPEKYQTPMIQSRNEHYVPNLFYLTKKCKLQMIGTNSRKNLVRSMKRLKKVYERVEQFQQKEKKQIDSFESDDLEEKIKESTNGSKNKIKRTSLEQQQLFSIIKPRSQLNRQRNPTKYQQLRQMRLQDKYKVLMKEEVFKQSYKEYKNYLPKCNISNILNKFHKNELRSQRDTLISFLRQKKLKKTGHT